jgi:hypothetical protein
VRHAVVSGCAHDHIDGIIGRCRRRHAQQQQQQQPVKMLSPAATLHNTQLILRTNNLRVTLHFFSGHFVPVHFVPVTLSPGHFVPVHYVPGHFVPRSLPPPRSLCHRSLCPLNTIF